MNSNLFIAEYFRYQHCLNIEQGVNLWHLLGRVLALGIPGDVVELGSMTGMTAAVMQRTIKDFGADKKLYLYDSFEGLPPIGEKDGKCSLVPENFKTSPSYTIERFNDLGLEQPIIVPGWFSDTLPGKLPEKICFAHLDGDLYESIKQSIEAVYPRLPPGAIALIDDYADDDTCRQISEMYGYNPYMINASRHYCPKDWLPGVRLACDEFLSDKPEKVNVLLAGEERHGYFVKQ